MTDSVMGKSPVLDVYLLKIPLKHCRRFIYFSRRDSLLNVIEGFVKENLHR
jgi:hypothetical protein